MTKTVITAAAFTLISVVPVGAAGYLGAAFDRQTITVEPYESTATSFSAKAAYGFEVDRIVLQLNGGIGKSLDQQYRTLSGHVSWGETNWRLGAVLSYSEVDQDRAVPNIVLNVGELVYGVEGKVDFTSNFVGKFNATLGQHMETETHSGILGFNHTRHSDTWNVNVGVSYYLSENAKIEAALGEGHFSYPGYFPYEKELMNLSLSAEYQPFDLPVSFTAGFHYVEDDNFGSNWKVKESIVSVGLRWNFGSETLRERDREVPFDDRYGYMQNATNVR